MNFLEFQERLLIGLLEDEEKRGEHGSDMLQVCVDNNLPLNEDWLVRFINENRIRGSGTVIEDYYGFSLNVNGLSAAQKYRTDRAPKTLWQKIKSIPRSDWIATGALLISLITAIFK